MKYFVLFLLCASCSTLSKEESSAIYSNRQNFITKHSLPQNKDCDEYVNPVIICKYVDADDMYHEYACDTYKCYFRK